MGDMMDQDMKGVSRASHRSKIDSYGFFSTLKKNSELNSANFSTLFKKVALGGKKK